jgi:hypothetical protein
LAASSDINDEQAARSLLSAAAVRERSHEVLNAGLVGDLEHWAVDLDRLPSVAAFVASVVRQQYPTLEVPFHARWRHFVVGGRDLWAEAATPEDADARARAAFDLAIVSVLLDAGAGMGWRYSDAATDTVSSRSEGLAIASFRLFEDGALSADAGQPLRADASSLADLRTDTLARGFQVSDVNPLVGLDGRAGLLRRLGETAKARPDLFALKDTPRPGGLYDAIVARADGKRVPGPLILEVLLEALGPIWHGRLTLGGLPLGDCWRHPAIVRDDASNGLVALHKLSQWLAYSLVEPLQAAGYVVDDLDGLTGLAEYRNGGLFFDTGVLQLRDGDDTGRRHAVGDPLVVGWRAMTVALLDRIAPLVRERLGVTAQAFPLARVLEGGTWAAGRVLAKQERSDGGPPLKIDSDGTVF